jgi:predicted MPP superfamily phosphohydrolase
MKKILFLLITAFIGMNINAQDLKFHNGTFKIVQFTDLHFKLHVEASKVALECIDEVLNTETPDLVVFTGDIVYSHPGDSALQAVLDVVSAHKIPFVMTFGNHDGEQSRSEAYTSQNGNRPVPAIAFFHIPLPEFNMAVENTQCVLYGTRMEKAYSPNLNSGMFTAIKECGDVMGVFCGHDHDNDYSVMYYGVLLAHGRFSGGNTEYNHLRNGARVIVLKEGKRELETWIHERGGQILYKTTYPTSYVKDNWKARSTTR